VTAVSLVTGPSIFSRAYCASLLHSPLLRVQTTVAFEGDVPDRDAPEQPLGVAIKALYDAAVMGRTAALAEPAVAPLLSQLQAALDALPADQRALLPAFTYVHYARAMALRAAAHPDHHTEELCSDPKKQGYWGSNRQLMFGKVAADVFDRNVAGTSAAFAPLHPITVVLASPTGGIIGPGTHNHWPELLGGAVYSRVVLNYHAVCHDASGYCRSALNLGPGLSVLADWLELPASLSARVLLLLLHHRVRPCGQPGARPAGWTVRRARDVGGNSEKISCADKCERLSQPTR